MTEIERRDQGLIEYLATHQEDYWNFSGHPTPEYSHAYLQYPAMMVPQMLDEILEAVKSINVNTKSILDPFMGSGTTMTGAMLHGLNFAGCDINPLAFLACKVKRGPLFIKSIGKKATKIREKIESKSINPAQVDFPGKKKWFKEQVAEDLALIKQAIRDEPSIWARRFFWIVLAETVRLCSNSRTSTFKLHIRPEEEIQQRNIDTVEVFLSLLDKNIEQMEIFNDALRRRGHMKRGNYIKQTSLFLGDVKETRIGAEAKEGFDCLITSPPYGDNKTTVPYGQFSYLPLQWIDLKDICPDLDQNCLSTTHELDTQSLGGRTHGADSRYNEIEPKSITLRNLIDDLKEHYPRDRYARVASFFADFDATLDPILEKLKSNAYMFWVIGNRKVGGQTVRSDKVLIELLQDRGCQHIVSIPRCIPSKRMATRNSITETMSKETIVVMRNRG